MVRVIVSFVGGWGHAEPLLPLAAFAKQLGHDVTFAGQAALGERIVRLGCAFDVVGPDTLSTTRKPLVPIDRDAERAVMRDHFIAGFGNTSAADLGDLFDREHVELVICDEVDVGAVIAAERRSIPCITVNVIAAGLLNHPAVVQSAWEQLRLDHNLPPDHDARRMGGELVIAPLPRSLRSPDAPVPPTMRFVRPPILTGRPRSDAANIRSLVYVTLGAGIALDPLTVTPAEIAKATKAVIDTTSYIEAAGALAAEANAQPGIEDLPELRQLLAPP